MLHKIRPALMVAAVLLALPACDGRITAPSLADVAGVYLLTDVSGRGPASGVVVLSPAGSAERRVRYRLPNGDLSAEFVASGTFQPRRDGTLDLTLHESLVSSFAWRPHAQLDGRMLRLRHPDPADGPDIVETYRRQ